MVRLEFKERNHIATSTEKLNYLLMFGVLLSTFIIAEFTEVKFSGLGESGRHMSSASSDTASSNILMASQQAGESSPLQETHSDPFAVPRYCRNYNSITFCVSFNKYRFFVHEIEARCEVEQLPNQESNNI